MKQIIKTYTFDKATRNITLNDFSALRLDRLQLITNVTTGDIIYQFNVASLSATVSGNTITVAYDTTAMSNSDSLQIIYDCTEGDPTYSPAIAIHEQFIPGYEDNVAKVAKVEQRFNYTTITTATTTVISAAPCFVHTITILGGTAGAITGYDNGSASGTAFLPTFTPAAVTAPVTIVLDEVLANGLTIVTGAATILNISWRQ
jgi:hypothetical protein